MVFYIRRGTPLTLHGFSDADWVGDTDDFVSTNAYVKYLGGTPISWSSKKQTGVARSSTEAKYRAIENTASEICWIISLLTELRVRLPTVPVIYCDYIGATHLSANPIFHFIRQNVQARKLRVTHVFTRDQLADPLTKALSKSRFQKLINKL